MRSVAAITTSRPVLASSLLTTSRGASRVHAAVDVVAAGAAGNSTGANATIGRSRPSSSIVKSAAVRPRTGCRSLSRTETSSRTTSTFDRNVGGCAAGCCCATSHVLPIHTVMLAHTTIHARRTDGDMSTLTLRVAPRSSAVSDRQWQAWQRRL
jgi:hypothetical protein